MNEKQAIEIAHDMAAATREAIERAVAPLRVRIVELESQHAIDQARIKALEIHRGPSVQYGGTHEPGKSYDAGVLVTRSGGLWLSLVDTTATPGQDRNAWRLVVKEGHAR